MIDHNVKYEIVKRRLKNTGYTLLLFFGIAPVLYGQSDTNRLKLSMFEVIAIAQDSSLQALINEYIALTAYWKYRNFKIQTLPILSLTTNPFTYYRGIREQFDTNDQSYKYFETQNLNSYLKVEIDQSLPFSGGLLSVTSDFGRLVNFGDKSSKQYSVNQIRVGINQPILAYNPYKWNKLIEPLEFQKSKLEYAKASQDIAIKSLQYYFDLIKADLTVKITKLNMHNADTLYQMGIQRSALTTITKADLLNLKLEYLNGQTAHSQALIEFSKAQTQLKNYLSLSKTTTVSTIVPDHIPEIEINIEEAMTKTRKYNPQYLDYDRQILNAKRSVEQAKKQNWFQANLTASVGLNQQGSTLSDAYKDPLDQEQFDLRITVPILDWGKGRSKYELAKKRQEVTLLSVRQQEEQIEQDIINTILDFNLKTQILSNTKEAAAVAVEVYEITKRRFLEGLTDVNTLVIQQQRKDNAQKRYFSELESYWRSYYYIQSITLYDFEHKKALTEMGAKFWK